jgi:hypothetical protein
MINARLYKFLNVHGRSQWLYRNTTLVARPQPGETLYVGTRDTTSFDEDQVSAYPHSVVMRTDDHTLHVWMSEHIWGEEQDAENGDEVTDLEYWLAHYMTFGWVKCAREPRPYSGKFSESWLLTPVAAKV